MHALDSAINSGEYDLLENIHFHRYSYVKIGVESIMESKNLDNPSAYNENNKYL